MRQRALAGALIALALAACKEEPSFDERYAATEQSLEKKAGRIDRDLEQGLLKTPRATATDTATDPAELADPQAASPD